MLKRGSGRFEEVAFLVGLGGWRLCRTEETVDVGKQVGDIMRYSLPDDVQINIEIAVNEAVSHPDDVIPRYDGNDFSAGRAHAAGCFTNDLGVLEDCQHEHAIMIEITADLARGEADGLSCSIPLVLEADKVSLARG